MDPVAFQTKWRTASSNLKERTASQSHFNDLCALVGVQNPIEADAVGDTYTFEKGAVKAGGGGGWADVWYERRFAWEYKGIGRDLDAAYVQLLKYWEDVIRVNLNSVFCVSKRAIPHLKRSNAASIINISSVSGQPVEDMMADALSQQSIPKMVDSIDIGALGVYLASDSGKGISGQLLSIDQDTQSI